MISGTSSSFSSTTTSGTSVDAGWNVMQHKYPKYLARQDELI